MFFCPSLRGCSHRSNPSFWKRGYTEGRVRKRISNYKHLFTWVSDGITGGCLGDRTDSRQKVVELHHRSAAQNMSRYRSWTAAETGPSYLSSILHTLLCYYGNDKQAVNVRRVKLRISLSLKTWQNIWYILKIYI